MNFRSERSVISPKPDALSRLSYGPFHISFLFFWSNTYLSCAFSYCFINRCVEIGSGIYMVNENRLSDIGMDPDILDEELAAVERKLKR